VRFHVHTPVEDLQANAGFEHLGFQADTPVTAGSSCCQEAIVAEKTYNVLFICTANSARSVIAESLLNSMAGGRFRAFSAGSHPKGDVHPLAIHARPGFRGRHRRTTAQGVQGRSSLDERRLDILLALPLERLDRLAIQNEVRDICTK